VDEVSSSLFTTLACGHRCSLWAVSHLLCSCFCSGFGLVVIPFGVSFSTMKVLEIIQIIKKEKEKKDKKNIQKSSDKARDLTT
jgi:hypothetical protein